MPALELRESGDGWTVHGHAATFNQPYKVGDFSEVVRPGAFSATLRSNPRVSLLLMHGRSGSGLPLATTTAGTLRLNEDAVGLAVHASLDTTDTDAQLARSKIRAGNATEMSFAFRIPSEAGQRWSEDRTMRELLAVDVHDGDVSICDRGANSSTTVDVRAATIGLEVRGYAVGLTLRQTDAEPDGDEIACVHCGGKGRLSSGVVCPVCAGTGLVEPPDDDDEDGRSARAKYSAAEKR